MKPCGLDPTRPPVVLWFVTMKGGDESGVDGILKRAALRSKRVSTHDESNEERGAPKEHDLPARTCSSVWCSVGPFYDSTRKPTHACLFWKFQDERT